MKYQIIHSTICQYDSPVSVCHYHAKLIPRRLPYLLVVVYCLRGFLIGSMSD